MVVAQCIVQNSCRVSGWESFVCMVFSLSPPPPSVFVSHKLSRCSTVLDTFFSFSSLYTHTHTHTHTLLTIFCQTCWMMFSWHLKMIKIFMVLLLIFVAWCIKNGEKKKKFKMFLMMLLDFHLQETGMFFFSSLTSLFFLVFPSSHASSHALALFLQLSFFFFSPFLSSPFSLRPLPPSSPSILSLRSLPPFSPTVLSHRSLPHRSVTSLIHYFVSHAQHCGVR